MERPYLLFVGLLVASCSSPSPPHCAPQPAFRLTIEAADARSLPPETTVQIRYGGQNAETYTIAAPPSDPQALFCRNAGSAAGASGQSTGGSAGSEAGQAGDSGAPGAGGAGGAAGSGAAGAATESVERLQCELWTDGAARVTIEGPGLLRYDEELAATKDEDCGVTTTEAQVKLGREGTAGSGGSGGSS